jgi:hypothetical protein
MVFLQRLNATSFAATASMNKIHCDKPRNASAIKTMRKIYIALLLLLTANFYCQGTAGDIKKMENVKYQYNNDAPFFHYDAKKKKLDYLQYFKAENDNTCLLVFHSIPNDSIKVINGGKIIKEEKMGNNTTGVRSVQAVSNLKGLEILFYKTTGIEKITITAEDLKKYKFIYVSTKQLPLHIEFTNFWKLFM